MCIMQYLQKKKDELKCFYALRKLLDALNVRASARIKERARSKIVSNFVCHANTNSVLQEFKFVGMGLPRLNCKSKLCQANCIRRFLSA